MARVIVRPTIEAEGSGFPEMKAMLFGKVLFNFLTFRVLVSKALALALGVGAGLPLGSKEGPNVHLAACIARVIDPKFFAKRVESTGLPEVAASFSAPIGGVIFSLELMLPQTYDAFAYWGCFTASVRGSICYAVERSVTTGASGLLPLISSNVLPGEGIDTDFPAPWMPWMPWKTWMPRTWMSHDEWILPGVGVAGTMFLCFLMKWTITILALSSAIPAGVVAPTMIIGGLLGRVWGHVILPSWLVDLLLSKNGVPPTDADRGAFMARCAIVGASAFCAAVCRAFAMAITVLALPNSVLPLSSSALAAIFVANRVSLPFFDANLATRRPELAARRNLGGIPAITFSDSAIEPVMKVMKVADMSLCTLDHFGSPWITLDHLGFLGRWRLDMAG
eukprot:Skav211678  [mRNA]  locus=scaffold216:291086:307815:- [translate_table: standard]